MYFESCELQVEYNMGRRKVGLAEMERKYRNTVLKIGIGSGLKSTQNSRTVLHTDTSEASKM